MCLASRHVKDYLPPIGYIQPLPDYPHRQHSPDLLSARLGIQAAICAEAFLLILLLQWKGRALRVKSGGLNFHTT